MFKKALVSSLLIITMRTLSHGAIGATMVWEVRANTGNDANAGCFDQAASSGTDYSQQNVAQYSFSNLVVDGAVNTRVSSVNHSFVAADVRNCLYITNGSGAAVWTTGYYEINSVTASSATLDRSPAAVSSTGGIWTEGGALFSLQAAKVGSIASNLVWMTGTDTTNVNINLTAGRLYGYGSVRGDNGFSTLQATVSLALPLGVIQPQVTFEMKNIIVDCNSLATTEGIEAHLVNGTYTHDVFKNCSQGGFAAASGAGTSQVINCEFTGMSTSSAALTITTAARIYGNWFHDNSVTAISCAGATIVHNLFSNNSGASSDGIAVTAVADISENDIFKCGRHGINYSAGNTLISLFVDNILSNNGGYGINATNSFYAQPGQDGNAYFSNTSGNRNNLDLLTGNNGPPAAYIDIYDVILNQDPYVNSANNDFRLNNNIGGGASCKNFGVPASWINTTLTNYVDIGAAQSQREFSYASQ